MERKSTIIDIDAIFESGREPTEEEWKEWASNFKPKRLPRRTAFQQINTTKKTASRRTRDRKNKQLSYRNKEKYKSWGDKYNKKRKYLYKYNEEWRKNLEETKSIYQYKFVKSSYDSWIGLYNRKYRYDLASHAYTFKINEYTYVHGFTETQLKKISPFDHSTFKKLKEDNMFPLPTFEGYRFKGNKISSKPEKFYLLTEAAAFFGVLTKNRKKFKIIDSEEKKLYLKKQFWNDMTKAKEEFLNE